MLSKNICDSSNSNLHRNFLIDPPFYTKSNSLSLNTRSLKCTYFFENCQWASPFLSERDIFILG